jgi:hypothetical protein
MWKKGGNKRIILNLVLILSISSLFLTSSIISVNAKQSFPTSFSEITYIKYSFNQRFTHYEIGTVGAAGIISVQIQKNPLLQYNFTVDHQLDVWTRGCYGAVPYPFTYNIEYRVEPSTREIIQVYTPGEMYWKYLLGEYVYYFIDTDMPMGKKAYILHDDMTIFRGLTHTSEFESQGVKNIAIQDELYSVIHMYYKGTLLYAVPYVCGIGSPVYVNATVNLYYDVNSGVLLYEQAEYYEWYSGDKNLWQKHQIERTITSIDYEGEPTDNEGFNDPTTENPFWDDPQNRFAVFIIVAIILASFGLMIVINKHTIKWKLDALRAIDNVEYKLKKEILDLKKELNLLEET